MATSVVGLTVGSLLNCDPLRTPEAALENLHPTVPGIVCPAVGPILVRFLKFHVNQNFVIFDLPDGALCKLAAFEQDRMRYVGFVFPGLSRLPSFVG